MSAPRGSILEFLEDMEPFFYRRSLLYVDVGAYKGEVFKKVLASRLKIREAHLLEPNPDSLELLQRNVDGLFRGHTLALHPFAAGATKETVRLRLAESMSKVVSSEDAATADDLSGMGILAVECLTLDELSLSFGERHISLLKIDVEGYEDQVLAGASALLSGQEVDVIYIEAGMNPAGTQQCYFRKIDDALLAYGYRLFRIYEQKHEWKEDSPFLRRADLAYFSPRFAERSPYLLARELFDTQTQLQSLQAQHDELVKRARGFADAEAAHTKALSSEQQRCRALDTDRADLKERAQALRRERTELTRRIVELEGSAHVDALTRDELSRRLAMMTESHQAQIIQLAEGRQAQRDLERQLAECVRELNETQQCLREIERGRSALATERDELGHKLDSLTRANEDLEQRVRDVSEANDQLNSLCQREREAHDRTLREQEARQLRLRKKEKARDLERQQENERAAHQLRDVQRGLDASEALAREVFQLYDALSRRESRARSEALRARTREERTRGHLSYRVGSALVANSRSPVQWIKIPAALRRAYGDFRRDSKGRYNEPAPEVQDVFDGRSNGYVSLRQQWTDFRIQTSGVQEVWARALTVRLECTVAVEVREEVAGGHQTAGEEVPGHPIVAPVRLVGHCFQGFHRLHFARECENGYRNYLFSQQVR